MRVVLALRLSASRLPPPARHLHFGAMGGPLREEATLLCMSFFESLVYSGCDLFVNHFFNARSHIATHAQSHRSSAARPLTARPLPPRTLGRPVAALGRRLAASASLAIAALAPVAALACDYARRPPQRVY